MESLSDGIWDQSLCGMEMCPLTYYKKNVCLRFASTSALLKQPTMSLKNSPKKSTPG